MICIAASEHPQSQQLWKTSFSCSKCDETRVYMLSAMDAAGYASMLKKDVYVEVI